MKRLAEEVWGGHFEVPNIKLARKLNGLENVTGIDFFAGGAVQQYTRQWDWEVKSCFGKIRSSRRSARGWIQ